MKLKYNPFRVEERIVFNDKNVFLANLSLYAVNKRHQKISNRVDIAGAFLLIALLIIIVPLYTGIVSTAHGTIFCFCFFGIFLLGLPLIKWVSHSLTAEKQQVKKLTIVQFLAILVCHISIHQLKPGWNPFPFYKPKRAVRIIVLLSFTVLVVYFLPKVIWEELDGKVSTIEEILLSFGIFMVRGTIILALLLEIFKADEKVFWQ